MTTPPDFHELIGDEGTPEELAKLRGGSADDPRISRGKPGPHEDAADAQDGERRRKNNCERHLSSSARGSDRVAVLGRSVLRLGGVGNSRRRHGCGWSDSGKTV